ncbi:tyrosine recombinase XerC [Anaerotignum sp.]|uniref:tyrosine recombinase XerC n=1 Tax=Anaerotignum sp. TaxID=2039241 RepID=UPI0028B171F6|nr:tyrosine recombinase XerC [Anaerotignum sp.]
MALKNYSSFPLLEEYLNYLTVIKGRSQNTVIEYRTDVLMFFSFLKEQHNIDGDRYDLAFVDSEFIRSITLNDMYAFISYCQNQKKATAGTRARKIVSIRQFWKYLKTKAKVIDNNVSEELETPKIPKRMPKHLTLEESIRLLIECENNPRDHCIITMFLNCALRLSELTSINIEQVSAESLRIIGKGNKERAIFLTPATKKAISDWLAVRESVSTSALFITKTGKRMTGRAVQDVVKKYLAKAGLDIKTLSTHKLRHTAATLMYQYGKVDIRALQQILGHDSIATTQIYTHVSGEQLERAVNSNPLAGMFGV